MGVGGPNAVDPASDPVRSWLPAECYILSAVSVPAGLECEATSLPHMHSVTSSVSAVCMGGELTVTYMYAIECGGSDAGTSCKRLPVL